ncbi:unnamed protein product [Urochloa humidicola]
MEMKVSGSGGSAASGSKKRPPSRLQKHAPASLQLEQGAATGAGPGPGAWGEGRAAIPLLSPLVMSPTMPVWEADHNLSGPAARRDGGVDQAAEGRSAEQQQQQQRGAARHGGGGGERQAHDVSPRPPTATGGGWRHPALATPVAEPASLVSFFQSQCAVEVRNAQQ